MGSMSSSVYMHVYEWYVYYSIEYMYIRIYRVIQKNDISLTRDRTDRFLCFIDIFVDFTMTLTELYGFTMCKSVSIDIDICGTN